MKAKAAVHQWKAIRDLAKQIESLERAFYDSSAFYQYIDIIGEAPPGARAIVEAADWMAKNYYVEGWDAI